MHDQTMHYATHYHAHLHTAKSAPPCRFCGRFIRDDASPSAHAVLRSDGRQATYMRVSGAVHMMHPALSDLALALNGTLASRGWPQAAPDSHGQPRASMDSQWRPRPAMGGQGLTGAERTSDRTADRPSDTPSDRPKFSLRDRRNDDSEVEQLSLWDRPEDDSKVELFRSGNRRGDDSRVEFLSL